MGDRKDLAMRNQRSFSLEFKRRAVEELLSGESLAWLRMSAVAVPFATSAASMTFASTY